MEPPSKVRESEPVSTGSRANLAGESVTSMDITLSDPEESIHSASIDITDPEESVSFEKKREVTGAVHYCEELLKKWASLTTFMA